MSLQDDYLQTAIKRFRMYEELGDRAFEQLADDESFHLEPAEGSNSLAIIIQHMHGNMLSRWTNFLTEDGEKAFRQRDAEFTDQKYTKQQLIDLWKEGWKCTLDTLQSLKPSDLEKTIEIRGEKLTVVDAINRQLAHYPYHVGQIVYLTKMIKGGAWKNLSIERGKSVQYNEAMKKPNR